MSGTTAPPEGSRIERPAIQSYVVDITLLDSPIPVNRTLTVPARLSFQRLHDAIQIAMGWKDYHLFEFKYGPYIIAPPGQDEMGDRVTWDAGQVSLGRLSSAPDDMLTYLYDFGDYWLHLIRIRRASADTADRPHCLTDQGVCPPEDVGGVDGYAHFLDVLQHPEYEEHAELTAWADGWWDATPCAIEVVEAGLASKFGPRPRRSS